MQFRPINTSTHTGETVYVMDAEAFTARFAPAEYDLYLGWDGTETHPNFTEPNPFNPARIHAATWYPFLADISLNGILEPVEVDAVTEECTSGHHRVVAARTTQQPIRFIVIPGPNGETLDLTSEDVLIES